VYSAQMLIMQRRDTKLTLPLFLLAEVIVGSSRLNKLILRLNSSSGMDSFKASR